MLISTAHERLESKHLEGTGSAEDQRKLSEQPLCRKTPWLFVEPPGRNRHIAFLEALVKKGLTSNYIGLEENKEMFPFSHPTLLSYLLHLLSLSLPQLMFALSLSIKYNKILEYQVLNSCLYFLHPLKINGHLDGSVS